MERNGDELRNLLGHGVYCPVKAVVAYGLAHREPASAMMLIFGAGVGMVVHRACRAALRR